MKTLEILAPAGSKQSFIASIEAGANSIYCGLQEFSARAKAQNFTKKELFNYLQYARQKNVKVYAALNTLIKENEIKNAIEILDFLQQIKIDAVIVQDLGIAKLIKDFFPSLKMHASTQLAIHNLAGVLEAQKLGFERVVLARELSKSEILEITKKSSIEIEIFAHGALCFSVSGMCLLSSFIGGLSANRGRCTQVCRRLWKHENKNGYFLSPKDLCLAPFINDIKELGVKAIKIEGRMKNAQYVHKVVCAYKNLLNDPQNLKHAQYFLSNDFARAKTSFNFTGTCEDVLKQDEIKQVGLEIGPILAVDKNNIFIKSDNEIIKGDVLSVFDKQKDETFKLQILDLQKENNTYKITVNMHGLKEGMLILKNSDAKYKAKIDDIFSKAEIGDKPFPMPIETKINTKKFKFLQNANSQNQTFIKIENINWLPLIDNKKFQIVLTLTQPNFNFCDKFSFFELPPYIAQNDFDLYQNKINQIAKKSKCTFFINNISHFSFFKNLQVKLFGGPFLYALNSFALESLFDKKIEKILFSIEDDFENISRLAKMNIANRAIFYLSGFAILAISKMKLEKIFIENKMYKISSSKDELQIMPYKNYSLVISKYPLMLFDKKPYLSKLGVNNFLIDLSFIPPNKNYLKTVLDAFNGTLNIKSDFGGNFLRGLK